MELLTGFPPVCGERSRVLILGSMPSIKSLSDAQYYAHPRNAFWPIMCELLRGEYVPDYAERCRMLTARGIALWDMCRSCRRETSADSQIRDVEPNPVDALIRAQGVERVLLNGGEAYKLYRRYSHADVEALRLPSTSPALTLPYADKLRAWRDALEGLVPLTRDAAP